MAGWLVELDLLVVNWIGWVCFVFGIVVELVDLPLHCEFVLVGLGWVGLGWLFGTVIVMIVWLESYLIGWMVWYENEMAGWLSCLGLFGRTVGLGVGLVGLHS